MKTVELILGMILKSITVALLGLSTMIIAAWGTGGILEVVRSYKENKEIYKKSLKTKVAKLLPGN